MRFNVSILRTRKRSIKLSDSKVWKKKLFNAMVTLSQVGLFVNNMIAFNWLFDQSIALVRMGNLYCYAGTALAMVTIVVVPFLTFWSLGKIQEFKR